MATTSIRWAVVDELVTRVTTAVDDPLVVVSAGFPGDMAQRAELIFVQGITSEVSTPVMSAGRRQRDDVFTIDLAVAVSGKRDLQVTYQRLEELCGHVEDVLADDHDFTAMDGLLDIGLEGVVSNAERSSDGFFGVAVMRITAHSRLI